MSQVIEKKRIVIASLLKPVNDTRMLEKMGMTLAKNNFDVHIVGFPSIKSHTVNDITFHPLSTFNRTGINRFFAGWQVLKKIRQVKPEYLMVNTPELLWVAITNKIFFGCKIYYDVLENYYRNIRFTPVYPSILRFILAYIVRSIERLSSPFIEYFFLAEATYQQELPFFKPNLILQNKLPYNVALSHQKKSFGGYKRLLFTGTLAESTGVFEAIQLAKNLHELDSSITLTIVGHCAIPETLKRIEQEVKTNSFIRLIGGANLVPHQTILSAIQEADFGIIIYPPNPSTMGSIPTKLFEYLALKLPILINHNIAANELVRQRKAGLVISDFASPTNLLSTIKGAFIDPQPTNEIYWESESIQLLQVL